MDPFPVGPHDLMERESSSGLLEESSLDLCKTEDISCNEPAGSSKEAVFWLNGYECSVCGIELPPSFIEERQEHFDFHLAERLQQDEELSNFNTTHKPSTQRSLIHIPFIASFMYAF